MIRTYVHATTTKEFFHRYKDAPDDVSYLRNLHRHLLHIKVEIEVFDDDREIEFIRLKHEVDNYLAQMKYDDNCSCETVAKMLLSSVQYNYGTDREIVIQVREDGENGVEVVYNK